jgi:tetratricopeptide (TPR) repeat protein
MGALLLRRGQFLEAEQYFRTAIKRLTHKNPNPYDGEPYYHLGMALMYEGRFDEACAAFYKATWNYAWQSPSYYALASIDGLHGSWSKALEHVERSILTNALNLKARNLKTAVLRRLGRLAEADAVAQETTARDPLDFWSRNECILLARCRGDNAQTAKLTEELAWLMGERVQTHLDIAFDYAAAGFWEEASEFLKRLLTTVAPKDQPYPMVLYSLGYFARKEGNTSKAQDYYERGSAASPDYCFPSRLEEMIVLEDALTVNAKDANAAYYLGNLLYDKRRYDEAIRHWEIACELDPNFSIPWRNLGIAYYNIRHDAEKARHCYRNALEANPADARLLYEMDQLVKRLGVPPKERLTTLERHPELVRQRDDLVVEQVTLYNQIGQSQKALDILLKRRFHPWEGGEGLVSDQYAIAHFILGRECLEAGAALEAFNHFESAQCYPHNLGEGKHLLNPENHLHYFAGLAREAQGDVEGAQACFRKACERRSGYSQMTYYEAMAWKKLGQQEAACSRLHELLGYAERQMEAEVQIDYFATSLPNFLLFEDALQKRNRIDCTYLKGLAHLGLGEAAQAREAFQEVVSLDINHLAAQEELRRLTSAS